MFYKHLKGVVSPEDCQAIIDRGLNIGFDQALVNQGDGTEKKMDHIRNNERVLFTDRSLAVGLHHLIKDEIPQEFKDVAFKNVGTYFRIYKYVPGQYFKAHRDGSVHDDGADSEITALFYLNDTDGGETVLMPYGKGQSWAFVRIEPKVGDVLLFEHGLWHEGQPVHSGEKFVLRTDLFYVKRTE